MKAAILTVLNYISYIMPPKTNKAPFGVAIKRFATIGFHPNLDPSGSMKTPTPLGPGQYYLNYDFCRKSSKPIKETWTRKKELEEFSRYLGFRNADILQKRCEDKSKRGPGTLEVNEKCFKRCHFLVKDDVLFGTAKRFTQHSKNRVPGPGLYGKHHEPHLLLEESYPPKKSWSPLQSFEWDGFIDRFKIGRFTKPWTLPPNRYSLKNDSIDLLLSKKVSKRGPFDLFTGPRDNSTVTGYFALSKLPPVKSWPMQFPSTLDRYKHKSFANYGKISKTERFLKNPGCRNYLSNLVMSPKDPNSPGPGYYNLQKTKTTKPNMYPFNCSILHVRSAVKWESKPGVGRYNVKEPKCLIKRKTVMETQN